MTPRAMSVSSIDSGEDEAEREERPDLLGRHHVDDHGVTDGSDHATADGHAAGQPCGHHVERVSHNLGRDEAQGHSRDSDAGTLHEDSQDLPHLNALEVALLGGGVHGVNYGDRERAANHRQEQASHGQRHGESDGGGDGGLGVGRTAVEREHHDDGGRNGGQGRIGRDGGADVRPTEGDHLQGAAEHDALLQVAGHETDERAGHERLVELELVQNTLHTGQQRDDGDQNDRKC